MHTIKNTQKESIDSNNNDINSTEIYDTRSLSTKNMDHQDSSNTSNLTKDISPSTSKNLSVNACDKRLNADEIITEYDKRIFDKSLMKELYNCYTKENRMSRFGWKYIHEKYNQRAYNKVPKLEALKILIKKEIDYIKDQSSDVMEIENNEIREDNLNKRTKILNIEGIMDIENNNDETLAGISENNLEEAEVNLNTIEKKFIFN